MTNDDTSAVGPGDNRLALIARAAGMFLLWLVGAVGWPRRRQ